MWAEHQRHRAPCIVRTILRNEKEKAQGNLHSELPQREVRTHRTSNI